MEDGIAELIKAWGTVLGVVLTFAAAIISAVLSYKSTKNQERAKTKTEDVSKQISEMRQDIKTFENNMQQQLQDAVSAINEMQTKVDKLDERISVLENSDKLQQEALKQLLGNAIDNAYFHYKERGSIPVTAKKNVKHIYDAYSAMNGNGEREKHWLFIDSLPVEEDS